MGQGPEASPPVGASLFHTWAPIYIAPHISRRVPALKGEFHTCEKIVQWTFRGQRLSVSNAPAIVEGAPMSKSACTQRSVLLYSVDKC